MEAPTQLFFDGLTPEELALVLAHLERRCFPADTNLLRQGDNPAELYIIQANTAEVLVTDHHGRVHCIDHSGPGD
ncbi:MAG: cyclic nucleotide-binding domain-containing protein [Chloroflexia bacterium]